MTRICLWTIACLAVAAPAQAQFFGIGGIVHDPGVMAQAVMIVKQTLQQISIATDHLRVANKELEVIQTIGEALPDMGRYSTPRWRDSTAAGGLWQEQRPPLPRVEQEAMQPGLRREVERLQRVDRLARRAANAHGSFRDYAAVLDGILDILDADITHRSKRTLTQVADTIAAGQLVQSRRQEAADRARAAEVDVNLEAIARERDADVEHAGMAARTQMYFLRAGTRD